MLTGGRCGLAVAQADALAAENERLIKQLQVRGPNLQFGTPAAVAAR